MSLTPINVTPEELEAAYRRAKAENYALAIENEALRHGMVSLVTRLNVIDHRHSSIDDENARRLTFEVRNVTVDLSIQDEGRTLKVFFRDPL